MVGVIIPLSTPICRLSLPQPYLHLADLGVEADAGFAEVFARVFSSVGAALMAGLPESLLG